MVQQPDVHHHDVPLLQRYAVPEHPGPDHGRTWSRLLVAAHGGSAAQFVLREQVRAHLQWFVAQCPAACDARIQVSQAVSQSAGQQGGPQ